MKTLLLALLLTLIMIGTGCVLFVPREALYLRSATGTATQENVRQTLGPPKLTSAKPSGESLWLYEVREEEPGSRWTSTGLWCTEYLLTFDRQGVLRGWEEKAQFHGGERMPVYCVPDGYEAKL
jgi:hypothetical protein